MAGLRSMRRAIFFLPASLCPLYMRQARAACELEKLLIEGWDLPEIQMDERRNGDRLQSVVGICVDCRSSSLPVPLLTIGIFSTTLTQHTCPL